MANKFLRHPWLVTITNLIVVMVLLTVSRLVFYYTNQSLFAPINGAHLVEILLGGMRFDLSAMLYCESVYILLMLLPLPARWRNNRHYQRVAYGWFLFAGTLMLVLNAADTMYFPFSDKRTTCTFFREFANDSNLALISLQAMVQYWRVSLITLVEIVLLYFCTRLRTESNDASKWQYYLRNVALMVVSLYMAVIGVRGSFGGYTFPIGNNDALKYTAHAQEAAIVLNTPFSLIRTIKRETYHHPHYMSDEEMVRTMNPLRNDARWANENEDENENVMIIVLESFSKEFIGFYNRDLQGGTYQGYTPFLDSLLAHSITYTESFASGRKSVDMPPSVLSSIPMLVQSFSVSPYSTNQISSLAERLKNKGYYSVFYHGAPNGSIGLEAYARLAQFDSYRGKDEYTGPAAWDGTWAIWDEEFLQYTVHDLGTLPEPWLGTVFTASSHHPFHVPKRYEGVFPEGTNPLHHCIGYSDMALRKFFDYARTQPWFEHTLFVITADHTSQLTLPEYTHTKGRFAIPIAFYHAGWEGELRDGMAVSQVDIMPSVLAYLKYDKPYLSFGEDILTQDKEHPWAIVYEPGEYAILSDSLMVKWNGKEVTGVYRHREDRLLEHDLKNEPLPEEAEDMLQYLKAYMQQYFQRMIKNELTWPKNE